MKKIGLLTILTCASAFADEFSLDYPTKQIVEPQLLRYVSVDVAAVRNLQGVVNVGMRNEGENNGYDLGISMSKAKSFSETYLYSSYLKFFENTENAKYYVGVGGRAGAAWGTSNHSVQAMGVFSAGRSQAQPDERRFFEINLQWPRIYRFHHRVPYQNEQYEIARKHNFVDFRNIQFSLFYGWFF